MCPRLYGFPAAGCAHNRIPANPITSAQCAFAGFGFCIFFALLHTFKKKSDPFLCLFGFGQHVAPQRLKIVTLACIICSTRTPFQCFQ